MASITPFPQASDQVGLTNFSSLRASASPQVSDSRRPSQREDFTKPETWQAALLSLSQLARLPTSAWHIEKLLPLVGLGLLFGASGTLKTFLLLDMLLSISAGIPFCGLRTMQSRVVYIGLEGQQGFYARVEAWLTEHPAARAAIEENFRVVLVPLHLFTAAKANVLPAFIEGLRGFAPTIVAVDTVSRTMGEGDENANVDMNVVIHACQVIEQQLGVLTMLVHHQAKNANKAKPTPRGASNLPAAADVILHASRHGSRLTLKNTKQKNGEEMSDLQFTTKSVSLGARAGEELTSLVLVPADLALSTTTTSSATAAGRCLLELLASAPPEGLASGDLEERSALSPSKFNTARRALEQAGLIAKDEGKRGNWRLTHAGRSESEIYDLHKSAA